MTSDPDSPAAGAAIRAAVTALPLALLGLFLAAISWRRWPDPLIDFGQQLYIPWRLSEGERLGRDLLYFHGPLSQHLHALLFRLCGVSFSTLIAANLLVVPALPCRRLRNHVSTTPQPQPRSKRRAQRWTCSPRR